MAESSSWRDRLREFLRGLSFTANRAGASGDRLTVDI